MNYAGSYRTSTTNPTISAPIQLETPPKKEPDAPKVETRIDIVAGKKDGKIWVKHQTIITDWKPASYYEAAVARKRGMVMAGTAQQKRY